MHIITIKAAHNEETFMNTMAYAILKGSFSNSKSMDWGYIKERREFKVWTPGKEFTEALAVANELAIMFNVDSMNITKAQ